MRVVRILTAAANEAAEAAAWYESERYGLGVEFERAIDAALDLLEEDIVPLTPAVGAAARKLGAKRLTLRRFHTTSWFVKAVTRSSSLLLHTMLADPDTGVSVCLTRERVASAKALKGSAFTR